VPATAGPRLDITSVAFSGVTAYPETQLRALIGDVIGDDVPAGRIENARQAILDLYRGDGYVYTAVTAQISAGVLTFIASEGYVSEVRLDGDKGPFAVQVLRFLNHLLDARPLKATVLERWLLLASDIPGVTVRAVLRPASGEPGALTLVAQLTHKTISGLLTADNRAYQYTGPGEGLALVDFNSLTSLGEQTELSLFHSLFDATQIFGQASTQMYLGGSGLKVKFYGGAGNNLPTGPLSDEGYFGFTTIFGSQFSYPLIRERQQTLNLNASFDALESLINTANDGVTSRQSYDSIRVLRTGADYAWFDLWAGETRAATNAVAVKVSQGLHILGASSNGAVDAPRTGERTDFFKITYDLSRTQALFTVWPQATVSLRGAVSGQYSPSILPPAEEYFLGGAHFNRGYYAGQVTGDTAVTGTVELLLDTPLPEPGSIPLTPSAQFYTFFDVGQAWNNQPAQENVTLRSTGLGVRFYPMGDPTYEFDLEGVERLNLFPNGSGPGVSPLHGQAVYWQVLARF
jgi:hemolysin activation/secretion protein